MSDFLSFHLSDDFVEAYKDKPVEWGFPIGGGNSLSELTFITKYSRKKEDGTKERWWEVCRRCVEGMYSILKDHTAYQRTPWNEFKAQKSAQDAYDRMFHFKWTPPGRGMQHMGTRNIIEQRNMARLVNCSALSTEKISTHSAYRATMPFVRFMEMSMNGIGVGASVFGAGCITLHQPKDETEVFVVPDTREGWAASLGILLESFFFKGRNSIEFDYSLIRSEGAPLHSFGGVASGYRPLQKLHEGVRDRLRGRDGELLTSRDIADIINMAGKACTAGGTRRSATILFGNKDDEDYINLKNWNLPENEYRTGKDGYAWASNNSVVVSETDDLSDLIDLVAVNGEPGFLWVDMIQKYGRLADAPDFKDYRATLSNPCVTSDAWIMTIEGARQVRDLIGTPHTAVVNGEEYPATGFWLTGDKQVHRVTLADGRDLRLTDNHQLLTQNRGWVEVANLQIGESLILNHHNGYYWHGAGSYDEGYLLGHLIGDGTFAPDGRAFLAVWERDLGSDAVAEYIYEIANRMDHRSDWVGWFHTSNQRRLGTASIRDLANKFGVVRGSKTITPELEQASSAMTQGVLTGLFDTDGSVQGTRLNGVSVRLTNTDRNMLAAAQRMLGRLGINSTVYFRRPERMKMLPDGHGGLAEYKCKPVWELVIMKANLGVFLERVGFKNPVKQQKLRDALSDYKRQPKKESWVSEVISIDPDGFEPVYDMTVDEVHAFDANGLMAHNCGEIPLEGASGEMCNLSEVYPTNHDVYEDFLRTLKHAYMYTKVVTLLTTPWAETNEVNLRNRRVGVSMTGLALFVETRGWSELTKWQDGGYKELKRLDGKYSEWLGVRESIRLTTVKPAGSTSLVAAVTPGVHWPTTSNYHLRRIRFLHSDPLVKLLEDAGYHVEPDLGDPDSTVVVTFPTEGIKIRSEREVSVWEKAALAVSSQRYWSDNMVSCTLSFLPHETKELAPLLASYSGQMKSASFLPIDESGTTYKQAPYEPIEAKDAQKWMSKVKPLDEISLYGNSMNEFLEDKFCTTDSCEISFG